MKSLQERDSIRVAVQQGNVEEAIERVNDLNPEARTRGHPAPRTTWGGLYVAFWRARISLPARN